MNKQKNIAILALTEGGVARAEKLQCGLPDAQIFPCRGRLEQILPTCWQQYDHLVCIMATGIVVRKIAPLLADKRTDPSVVVCDEKGRFAVSLLSGHFGGGNELAETVAGILGGQAVITTASDVLGHTALDIWARDLGLVVADKHVFTRIMGKLVNSGSVNLYSEYLMPELPPDILSCSEKESADLVISSRTGKGLTGALLHPQTLVAGIGCNRNTPEIEISQAFEEACQKNGLALQSICRLASIDLKKDEKGLLEFAENNGYPLEFFHRDQLNGVDGISTSAAVLKATGAKGVAEPSAILAAGGGRLLVKKMKWQNVTVAIAEMRNFL